MLLGRVQVMPMRCSLLAGLFALTLPAAGCSLGPSYTGGPTGGGPTGGGPIEPDPTSGVAYDSDAAGLGGTGGGGGAGGGEGGTGAILTPPPRDTCDPGISTFYLSPDDSNSMGSWGLAREQLRRGEFPDPASVRPYEFLNYASWDLEPPESGLAVRAEVVDSAESDPGRVDLWLTVTSAPLAARPPAVVTFVVDTSASMAGEGFARARAAIAAIVEQLAEGDVVNVVTWSSAAGAIVEGRELGDAADRKALGAAIGAELAPYGSSNLAQGLLRGYQVALERRDPTRVNRVVLVSDGAANAGSQDTKAIAEYAADGEGQGIYLLGVGVGPANGYSDALMNAVTDAGRGAYLYIDDPASAATEIERSFEQLVYTGVSSVTYELDLPRQAVVIGFSGEVISQDQLVVSPQLMAPGDTIVVRHELQLPQVCIGTAPLSVRVSWRDATGAPGATGLSTALVPAEPSAIAWKASAILAVANALAEPDPASRGEALARASETLASAIAMLPDDGDLLDLSQSLEALP